MTSNKEMQDIPSDFMIVCYTHQDILHTYFKILTQTQESPRDVLLQKKRIDLESQLRTLGVSNIELLKQNAQKIQELLAAISLLQQAEKK